MCRVIGRAYTAINFQDLLYLPNISWTTYSSNLFNLYIIKLTSSLFSIAGKNNNLYYSLQSYKKLYQKVMLILVIRP